MNSFPMSMELLVADLRKLVKEEREADVRLIICLSIVCKRLMAESVVNLLQSHDVGPVCDFHDQKRTWSVQYLKQRRLHIVLTDL